MKLFRIELKNWPATKFGPLYQEPSTSVFGNDSAKNVQHNWAAHLCLSCLVCIAYNNKGKQAFSLFHLSTIVQVVKLLALFPMATHRPLKLNQESRKHVWRFQTMNSRRSLYNFGGASPWTLHGLIVLLLYWHATVRSRRAARQWSHGPCGFMSAGQEQWQGRHFLAEKELEPDNKLLLLQLLIVSVKTKANTKNEHKRDQFVNAYWKNGQNWTGKVSGQGEADVLL